MECRRQKHFRIINGANGVTSGRNSFTLLWQAWRTSNYSQAIIAFEGWFPTRDVLIWHVIVPEGEKKS